MFYIDDLKIYAKDDSEPDGLLRIAKGFTDDIYIELVLCNCANATFKRGKLEKPDHLWLDEEAMIKDLDQKKVYKYLDVNESNGIEQATMKQKLKNELVKIMWLLLKTELNS